MPILPGLHFYSLFTCENELKKKSEMFHEMGQYFSDFDDFGALEKPSLRSFQRHQNHQNPLGIDSFHDPFLIRPESIFRK